MGGFRAGWSLGTIRRHGPGEVLAMGSCGTCLPPWATAFLHRPVPPPPASPSPSPSSPFPPRLCCGRCCLRSVSSRSVSCCRVPWPACLSLPLFASCLVSASFRFASFAVCLIGSFQGPYHDAYVTCSSYWSKPCPFHQIANSISFTAGCRILIFKRCLIDIGVGTSITTCLDQIYPSHAPQPQIR